MSLAFKAPSGNRFSVQSVQQICIRVRLVIQGQTEGKALCLFLDKPILLGGTRTGDRESIEGERCNFLRIEHQKHITRFKTPMAAFALAESHRMYN